MSRPIALYDSNFQSYSDLFKIDVNIYFRYIVLFDSGEKTEEIGTNTEKYVLSLKLNEIKSELTFEMIFKNQLYSGILYINSINGNVSSYLSESLNISVSTENINSIFSNFDQIFTLDFSIKDCRDLRTFNSAKIQVVLQEQEGKNTNMSTLNKFLSKINSNTEIQMYYQTDNLAVNLGEMVTRLTSNHSYPNGFPKKLIGYCKNLPTTNTTAIDTYYSFRPKLQKVLKSEGENLLNQTNKINEQFNNIHIEEVEKNCIFFNNILAYSTLRYMFAGLSNNSVFSCKWLYSNNYNKFRKNLENSEFAAIVPLFTEPQPEFGVDFSDYNKYYRSCVQHK